LFLIQHNTIDVMVMFPQEEQAKDHWGSSFSSISLWIIWVSWFNIILCVYIFFLS